jgi:YHS domain-containing protein
MKRLLTIGLMIGLMGMATGARAGKGDKEEVMEGLRELSEFIGGWKGSGSTKLKPGPRDPFWAEKIDWSWRFKGDDVWLSLATDGGKFLKTGELRYLPGKKKYELTVHTPEGKDLKYEGTYKDEKLVLSRTDSETKEVEQVKMNTAAEGIRFIYQVEKKTSGGTIWKPEFAVSTTKIGESLAKTEKGHVCVVSGGKGTTAVSFGGETFYVCCSGCADAFKENPKKYVDEFKAKKGK